MKNAHVRDIRVIDMLVIKVVLSDNAVSTEVILSCNLLLRKGKRILS